MATSRKNERRLLNDGEIELVAKSRQPELKQLSDKDISQLVKQLRERRDRARDIADKQRRAVRGKSRQQVQFDQADAGNRQKMGVLAEALARVNKERSRRAADAS
ncbi:hypothetical protein, partial [Aquamicrobium sp. LC103]|uniref:hypothetical protein n=1 Tax=Aquamicrobium sp. LC103 TaxID=1120658 RepID=UPI00063E8AC7